MENTLNLKEKEYIEKVSNTYQEKRITKLDELRLLDKKATLGPKIAAYTIGIIATLILGIGMCFAMEVFPELEVSLMWPGIGIGIIGLILCVVNYFLYKQLLMSRKKKYANKILELSKSLLNE